MKLLHISIHHNASIDDSGFPSGALSFSCDGLSMSDICACRLRDLKWLPRISPGTTSEPSSKTYFGTSRDDELRTSLSFLCVEFRGCRCRNNPGNNESIGSLSGVASWFASLHPFPHTHTHVQGLSVRKAATPVLTAACLVHLFHFRRLMVSYVTRMRVHVN